MFQIYPKLPFWPVYAMGTYDKKSILKFLFDHAPTSFELSMFIPHFVGVILLDISLNRAFGHENLFLVINILFNKLMPSHGFGYLACLSNNQSNIFDVLEAFPIPGISLISKIQCKHRYYDITVSNVCTKSVSNQ